MTRNYYVRMSKDRTREEAGPVPLSMAIAGETSVYHIPALESYLAGSSNEESGAASPKYPSRFSASPRVSSNERSGAASPLHPSRFSASPRISSDERSGNASPMHPSRFAASPRISSNERVGAAPGSPMTPSRFASSPRISSFFRSQAKQTFSARLRTSGKHNNDITNVLDSNPATPRPGFADGPKGELFYADLLPASTVSLLDSKIERSKEHWSDLRAQKCAKDEMAEANRETFESLNSHPEWGSFFGSTCFFSAEEKTFQLVLGEKIAEGAQAEIFKGIEKFKRSPGNKRSFGEGWRHRITQKIFGEKVGQIEQEVVVKVFKRGSSLRDLQSQWPLGMLKEGGGGGKLGYYSKYACWVQYGTLLEDGRFALVMDRCWGDLRKYIDDRMSQKSSQGPPFSTRKTRKVMLQIATGVQRLHEKGVVHRDIKASNVLLWTGYGKQDSPDKSDVCHCRVADFECSVGVVGTAFWRPPEILEAVRNRSVHEELFTKKSDAYSFAMTCYEILTGQIPFEDHSRDDIDDILRGRKLQLPDYVGSEIKSLLNQCWHLHPSKRPTFKAIVDTLGRVKDI